MSIKMKLSLFISLIVTVVLTLNISIYYITTREELLENAEQQTRIIAKQIGATVEVSEQAKQLIEDSIGSMLRMAAIATAEQLPPKIADVTNDQLTQISKQLTIDHISLWKRIDNDIIVLKSSDPNELNMSSKSWDYWYTAFNQLFDGVPVTIPQGQKLPNYWSGPYNFATSNPNIINKWGNYYDGTTDYMINPYINADMLLQFEQKIGTNAMLSKMIKDNDGVLEITGFDPRFFGKDPILKIKQGMVVHNLDVRGVIFGQYVYVNQEADLEQMNNALRTGEMTTVKATISGQNVLKSFIPMSGSNNSDYVIGITIDQDAMEQGLNRQLLIHTLISLGLIAVTLVASYFISGFLMRSLNQVLVTVNQIAAGNFGTHIPISGKKDELGLLATSVNSMSDNLDHYMNRLKDSAEELRSTKEYLESFINHTSDAIHVSDLEGNVTQANKAFEDIYGWTAEELDGAPYYNIPSGYEADYIKLLKQVLEGEAIADYETVRLTKDGRMIDVSLTISPIRDGRGKIIAIASISRNITARKQTEEVLRRSEKLSVVGQLAAGVAHEIRNPLQTLKGFVQLNKSKGTLNEGHLDIMLSELDRINFIVSEFLVLAKPQVTSIQPIDIRETVNSLIVLLDSQAHLNSIEFETAFEAELPQVMGEPNQLKQVFLNIMKNAMEAMQDGGTIRIEIAKGDDKGQVVIRFIDQGVGMTEEELQRIGEPFFTNKETGTGLGLMVCQQIVANHKGKLNFYSQLGEGTTVEVILGSNYKEA
ncbi:ATP-binding protein [Paenibacillus abyssi]|uniref:histidine kinase n=1 Tax=Paenibacillus abyssi TaxID=1340531 RepID=A0A917CMC7_9BACL|nr:ATP-binding protein [Paenibacillus abyssi]GGF92628.1 hypothetical protein GCM10010916_07490 [Paenibacillus abyssi]